MNKFSKDERGTTALLFGLLALPILGATGMAMDYGRMSSDKSAIQSALDAAVLGGVPRPSAGRDAFAQMVYSSNLPAGLTTPNPTFVMAADGTYSGTLTYTKNTTLARLAGFNTLDAYVTASAKMTTAPAPPAPSGTPSGACVLLLDNGTQSLLVNSGANIVGPNCEIHVKSTASPAAIFNAGTTLNLKKICIQGNTVIQNGGPTPNLSLGCTTVSDTFAGNLPPPPSASCTFNNLNYSGTVTLTPGVYCGWFNFNAATNVTFQPGVYIIQGGGWNVNGGSFKGAGVTFYFNDTSKIQFNSSMDTDLTAPVSGTYKGILMYECVCLSKSDFIFNSSIANRMEGLIYLPSRNVTFNAQSGLQSDKTTMVFNRLILNNVGWNVQPNPDRPLGGTPTPGPVTPPVVTSGVARLVR
jgi:Flp pilus assembly protein TadG